MRDIVMTIRGRHVRNMRLGNKRFELRKNRPANGGTYRVFLCQSGTGGKIVGAFTCREWVDMAGKPDMEVAMLGCVTAAEVQGYRQDGRLWGWRIEDFEYFGTGDTNPRHILDYGLKRPPQSWCYAKEAGGDG